MINKLTRLINFYKEKCKLNQVIKENTNEDELRMISIAMHKYFGCPLYEITVKQFFELNIFDLIINMKDHFQKYVKEITKLPFERQWEYVQKTLVSKNNVDI